MTRIIGGVAGGRRIAVPPRGTRPTTDRVRESLLMQSGTLPTTPASRASSISRALSGKLLPRSLGCRSVVNRAVWNRRNASSDSSATHSAAAPARDE